MTKLEETKVKELFAFCEKHQDSDGFCDKNCPFVKNENLIDEWWCVVSSLKDIVDRGLTEIDIEENENEIH